MGNKTKYVNACDLHKEKKIALLFGIFSEEKYWLKENVCIALD